MSDAGAEPTLIASVQRALRLVDIIANSSRPLPVKTLSALTGLTPGTTYNLVRTLVHEGYLSSERDGLVLGTHFPSLQQGVDVKGVFLARVRAALRQASASADATAYLSRYHDGEMRLVDIVEADRTPRVELFVGVQDSAHASAMGKQILTDLPDADRLDYLSRHPLIELTPRTISDRRILLEQLERSRGWAFEEGEYAIGNTCVSVPVIAPNLIASLAVSLPSGQAIDRGLVRSLQSTARCLSVRLGADALDTGVSAQFTI